MRILFFAPVLFLFITYFFYPVAIAAIPCDNLLPGISRMTLGVDVTRVNFQPMKQGELDGYKGCLMKFTCDEGKTWRNPYNNETYKVPDQIWSISTVPSASSSVDWTVYNSVSDVEDQLNLDIALFMQMAIPKAISSSFNAFVGFEKIKHQIKEEKKIVYQAKSFVSAFSAALAPPLVFGFSQEMEPVINRLPKSFDRDPRPYFDFIQQFGTHYISSAKFGGYVNLVFALTTNRSREITSMKTGFGLAQESSELDLSKLLSKIPLDKTGLFGKLFDLLKKYLLDKIDIKMEASSSVKFGSSSISNVTTILSELDLNLNYHGGQTSVFDVNNIESWENSVPSNPWLFAGNLVPIFQLISDDERSSSMEKAMYWYIRQPYVEDLWNRLQNESLRYQFVEDTAEIASLFRRTEKMKTSYSGSMLDLERLVNEIDFQLKYPRWWAETKLCYKTVPHFSGKTVDGQCPESGPICASGSNYTSFYKDTTRNSPSTHCWMEWGIVSPAYRESWFDDVQICFSSTCGRRDENCASVNQYTDPHLDESALSFDKDGCGLTWKLRVPDPGEVPYWFKNIQLCVKLSGELEECQSDKWQTTLCARHNEWTTSVWDSSNDSNYGCGYKWGLVEILE